MRLNDCFVAATADSKPLINGMRYPLPLLEFTNVTITSCLRVTLGTYVSVVRLADVAMRESHMLALVDYIEVV